MPPIRRSHRARRLGLGTLLAALLLTGLAPPLSAVDTPSSPAAPELAPVRAKIKAKDWPAAIRDLNAMIDEGVQQADVYSLLGFSLRKSGELREGLHLLSQGARVRAESQGRARVSGRALRRKRRNGQGA